MGKTVVMFAGQGSQYKNMGLDFLQKSKDSINIFTIASHHLDFDIKEVLNSELINETKYTQPLTFLTSIIIYNEVKKILKPNALLGFSLGEYSALYESGMFSLVDMINIIKKRSLLMSEASTLKPGAMQAIIGLDDSIIEKLCNETSKPNYEVSIANYNSPKQTVISGNEQAVEEVANKCLDTGARRAIKLNVSGAFHTPYMKDAGKKLELYIKEKTFIYKPRYAVWLNATGKKYNNESIATIAKKQIQSPVLFKQSIQDLIENGYDTFIEIGPGSVLSGLVKKINRGVKIININKYEDLEKLKELD